MSSNIEARTCRGCKRHLPQTSYTARQWTQGNRKSLCVNCFLGDYETVHEPAEFRYSHRNNSDEVQFSDDDLNHPIEEGSCHVVATGIYTKGERAGEVCIGKWFSGHIADSDDYFALDVKTVDMAWEIVKEFNKLALIKKPVRMTIPNVFVFCGNDSARRSERILVEPYIRHFQKFNSNTGWTDESSDMCLAMQALSHFSYHHTNGNQLLCDLQGGIRSSFVILTDPAILSRNLEFGPTDLGPRGMSSFFGAHVCNKFCHRDWLKPKNPPQYHEPVEGSSVLVMNGEGSIFVPGCEAD